MLKIRLQRVGRKHEPSFRLVLTDSKNSTKSGRFAEMLGNYDPRKSIESLKADRIKHWLALGAGVTGSVNNLLIKKGIIRGKKTHVGADNVMKTSEPTTDNPQPTTESAPEVPTPTLTESEVGAPTESVGAESAPESISEVTSDSASTQV